MSKSDLLRKRNENFQQMTNQPAAGGDMLDEIARRDGVLPAQTPVSAPAAPKAEEVPVPAPEAPAKAAETPNIDNKETLEQTAAERADELPMDESKSEVVTMHKEVIPEDKKNLTLTKSFSIDRETLDEFTATAEVLRASGVKIDGREVTESSLIRLAIKDEVARLEKKNGKAFRNAINEILNRSVEKKPFSL